MLKIGEKILELTTEKIITDEIIETPNYLDGKKVYLKRVNFGALPNNTNKSVNIGFSLTNVNLKGFGGMAYNPGSNQALTIPYGHPTASVYMYINGNSLNITTTSDRSAYTETYVDIYFTYKE